MAAIDQPEVALDSALASGGICAEPGLVSARAARDTLNVGIGLASVGLGAGGSVVDEGPLSRRAAHVGNPLIVGVGDSEIARKLDLGKFLNSGV